MKIVRFIVLISILCALSVISLYFLSKKTTPSEVPQQTFNFRDSRQFTIGEKNSNTLDILLTTLPKFALNLADEKFKNVWEVKAAERHSLISANFSYEDDAGGLRAATTFDPSSKQVVVSPVAGAQIRPGLYQLRLNVRTYKGEDITITQDFTWGVLAINTNKAVYKPGDVVKIGMGVLDDHGNTKCMAQGPIIFGSAKIWLTVTSPSGQTKELSTDGGTISGKTACEVTSVTNTPDFQAYVPAQEVGRYTLHMEAENINGKMSIDDYFVVEKTAPAFDVERTSYPMRINPKGYYTTTTTVIANEDYSGEVDDYVPSSFTIPYIADGGTTTIDGQVKTIKWNVDWKKGQTYKLQYDIKFPYISPEFYLIGPITIGSFKEGREWQIASDAIAQVQKNSNINNGSTSSSTVSIGAATAGNLLVMVCSSTSTSGTWGNISGWSRAVRNTTTSAPRQAIYYRSASGTITSTTCTFSTTALISNMTYEWSGATNSVDRTGQATTTTSSSTGCNSGSFSQTSGNATSTNNPEELIITGHVGVTKTTIVQHTSGYTDEYDGNGSSSGTFTSASRITSATGTYSDSAQFAAKPNGCAGVIATFNEPLTKTQNGFEYYQNIANVNPSTAYGAQNANLALTSRNQSFRLRLLIDIDGTQTLAIGGGDYILQFAPIPSTGKCKDITNWIPVSSTSLIAYNSNGLGSDVSIGTSGPGDPSDLPTYTTSLEDYYEDNTADVTNDQNSLTNNHAGEWDFSLIDNSPDTTTTTYCIAMTNGDTTLFDGYAHYPEVTTLNNDVNITGGTVIHGGTNLH